MMFNWGFHWSWFRGCLVAAIDCGRRCNTDATRHPQHNKTTHQHDRHSSGANEMQRQVGPPRHHVRALLTGPTGNITNGKYLQWEPKLGHAYCKGFKYINGDLVVPRKGYYRVFLQVTYVGGAETCAGILNVTVLYLQKGYGVDVPLLSTYDTVTCNDKSWIKSLHTSGMFSPAAKSRLHVYSSREELIGTEQHQMFFGVELVPRYSKPDKN
ncbi:LOW QUALITY PROTEIN: tumor necrosis factor ligand superfamily member 15-like [Melanotaenia boesemani]|uniref:LOW QUALITY PROTEIN: tumor necrosis factor ligand superfamily member 15-like n=1 Tax=Melanotaenia boesemani TaxID=1250792 RepID=UPI001C05D8BD|nr:LOW QUALITY PROTEIN: tumor necrosis factor ligand superfamily member 15-like [Melanotaenia boesemani]